MSRDQVETRYQDPEYLGDGVYAGHDGYQVWVWTHDGICSNQPIALEPEVMASLTSYYQDKLGRRK